MARALAISGLFLVWLPAVSAQQQVCYTGYVMDVYCINRGSLLDTGDSTLERPDRHSLHCLVDVSSCRSSGYELLTPDKINGTHCRAYKLDARGNSLAIDLARSRGARGGCSTCTGATGSERSGFLATVVGRVTGTLPPFEIAVDAVHPSTTTCAAIAGVDAVEPPAYLCTGGEVADAQNWHGGLMLLGWGVLLPGGALFARFGRHRTSWYPYHRNIQLAGVASALLGLLVALVNLPNVFEYGWGASKVHGLLGTITMALGALQPLNALVRPHRAALGEDPSPHRRAWQLLHRSVGWSAVGLAVPTILLGATIHASLTVAIYVLYAIVIVLLLLFATYLSRESAAARKEPPPAAASESATFSSAF